MLIERYVKSLIERGVDPSYAAEIVTAIYTLGVNNTVNRTTVYQSTESLLRQTPRKGLNRPIGS